MWGIIFFMIAGVIPFKDHFVVNYGGQQHVITSQEYPVLYWGTDFSVLFVAISLAAYGFYRSRDKR